MNIDNSEDELEKMMEENNINKLKNNKKEKNEGKEEKKRQ